MLVSADADFTEPLIEKTAADALTTTAWQSEVDLEYETTYYWKVRAISEKSHSAWSAVGVFTTESPPPEPEPEPQIEPESTEPEVSAPFYTISPTSESDESGIQFVVPPPSSQLSGETIIPVWATYIFVALLSIIALLLVVVIVMVVRIRRL